MQLSTIDFTPDYYNGKEGAPVYRLAPLSMEDLADCNAVVASRPGFGASPSDSDVLARLRVGVRAVLGDAAVEYEAAIDRLEELTAQAAKARGEERTQLVEEMKDLERTVGVAEEIVSSEWEDATGRNPFNLTVARQLRFRNAAQFAYARRALVGWCGDDLAPYARDANGCTREAFALIPARDQNAIAVKAMASIRLGEGDAGN